MEDLLFTLRNNYQNVARISLFNNLKTGNYVLDAISSSIVISLIGLLTSFIYDNLSKNIKNCYSFSGLLFFLYNPNCIVYEGSKTSLTSIYSDSYSISTAHSESFKAIWEYILNNVEQNNDIYKIKEVFSNYSKFDDIKRQKNTSYIVFQNKHFKLNKDIFIFTYTEYEDQQEIQGKKTSKIEKTIINLYSYKLSISELIKFVDELTKNYLSNVKTSRFNKKFIYSLITAKENEEDSNSNLSCWKETLFESYRTFDNIFFDGKKDVLEKIDFFINNRNWYVSKGIPYTLGIGLYGPPGTGKTSFIKSLCNYTDRNMIVISLKIIKTKKQLEKFFFENRYNTNNEKDSMTFDKKIIVFEDIDCIGDIVLERNNKTPKNKREKSFKKTDVIKIGDVIQGINSSVNNTSIVEFNNEESPLTLDDILNLWDGIRETPGRIIIISSNHYNKLDAALTRPGRIDISHEFSNASHQTIKEIYYHLLNKDIDNKKLVKIKPFFYSPAELINIFVSYKNENQFIQRLMQNKKVNVK